MTERALLLKFSATEDGRYFAVGTEAPTAIRVFSTATSGLVAVCSALPADVAHSQRTIGHRRGDAELLTALSIGASAFAAGPTAAATGDDAATAVAAVEASAGHTSAPLVVMGTSIGRVTVFDVLAGKPRFSVGHSDGMGIAVVAAAVGRAASATAAPVVLVVTSRGALHAFDAATGAPVARSVPIAPATKSLCFLPSATSAQAPGGLILAGGSQPVVYGVARLADHINGAPLQPLVMLGSQTTGCDFTWVSPSGSSAVTAAFEEGAIRVWDTRPTDAAMGATVFSTSDRCRRWLHTDGLRICGVSVLEAAGRIVATTVSGTVLVWTVSSEGSLAFSATDVTPMRPSCVFTSAPPTARVSGRLLAALLLPHAPRSIAMVRGTWGTPLVQLVGPAGLEAAALQPDTATELPLPQAQKRKHQQQQHEVLAGDRVEGMAVEEEGAVAPPPVQNLQGMGRQRKRAAGALKGLTLPAAGAIAFPKAEIHRAADVSHLPGSAGGALDSDATSGGGATAALYQALHARDAPLVTELLVAAGRTAAGREATVMALELPYVVQLLELLAERLAAAGLRSPLHAWVNTIMLRRGAELRDLAAGSLLDGADPAKTTRTSVDGGATAAGTDVCAALHPLLDRYRRLLSALQHRVAFYAGRTSIVRSIRPDTHATATGKTGLNPYVGTFAARFTETTAGVFRDVESAEDEDVDGAVAEGDEFDEDATLLDLLGGGSKKKGAKKGAASKKQKKLKAAHGALVGEDEDAEEAALLGGRGLGGDSDVEGEEGEEGESEAGASGSGDEDDEDLDLDNINLGDDGEDEEGEEGVEGADAFGGLDEDEGSDEAEEEEDDEGSDGDAARGADEDATSSDDGSDEDEGSDVDPTVDEDDANGVPQVRGVARRNRRINMD
jgi:hypothetical protein